MAPTFTNPDESYFWGRRSVRDSWIALWVMWMLWMFLFLAKQIFGSPRVYDARGDRVPAGTAAPDVGPYGNTAHHEAAVGTTTAPVAAPVNQHKGHFGRTANNMRERIRRTHNLVRDLTLMLLLALTVNAFGSGSAVFVNIMAWIFTALAFMWAGAIMMVESRILDMAFGVLEMLSILAILIAAYAMGWRVL
ncbi:hypothetical protein BX616_009987 [Lobosporangium transversale]|uniref:Uncharacterized protein n=1 Tax=Lobosporangium transversale TaxID=64571 RepID=A0A1Y2GJ57_9FUNG|nr:hypothetical protein BCR41DRAFT_356955 [Lobosporangium transversale]KAF9919284.1 hypothetical protein BX616_009987 [Lobosporangium transversale]ORZ11272.1 hypothetical protein BCR41DRAFT_356955 [Lobosporangium transversale]|eukprot:XP_021879587.1 hypothetical protein BCR41DRAFT_356955 [Lobosporangium transversale]